MTVDLETIKNASRRSGFRKSVGVFFKSRLSKIGAGILVAIFLMVIIGSLTVPYNPSIASTDLNQAPSMRHIFGTDYLGHDIFSQVVWGAYPSLLVSLYTALAATFVGFVAGVYAGYYRRLEPIIGGATDIVMSFPALPLLIIIGMIILTNDSLIAASLIIVLWAPVARAVRSQTMSVKKLAFVEAAKTTGLNDRQIVWKIVIFEVAPIAVAYFIINISLGIILITALQFLGVGNPLNITWGSILYWAQQYAFDSGAWWWILAPGLIITLTTTGFALIGYSVEEVMNPRLRS